MMERACYPGIACEYLSALFASMKREIGTTGVVALDSLSPNQLPLRTSCILRSVRATVPLSGEPLFRGRLSHCDVAD